MDHSEGGKFAVVEFTAAAVAVMENEGKVRLGIKRTGRMDIPVSIRYIKCQYASLYYLVHIKKELQFSLIHTYIWILHCHIYFYF